jgi:hypothetical protein
MMVNGGTMFLRERRLFHLAVALYVAVLAAGCSLLIEPQRQQCQVDADCQSKDPSLADAVCVQSVCEPNPAWSCLGEVAWPPPSPRKSQVVFRMRDLITDAPLGGVTGRVCNKLDFDCLRPLASGLVSDSAGTLTFELDSGFDGFVEFGPPGRMPGVYFFYPPVNGDREFPSLPLMADRELAFFASQGGRPIAPDRGHVMLGSYDCLYRPADGVVVTSEDADAATAAFYLVKKVPSFNVDATDSSGRAGLINLRSGSVSITGLLASDQRQIATVGVFVRPGTITYTTMLPAPK